MVSVAELARRPSRPPDHAAENRALVALAQAMVAAPGNILQKLAEAALVLCRAESAGLSLLEDEDQRANFHWRAIAGRWASHRGGGTPRDFGPCGVVLDRNVALLCSHPERDFPYFGDVTPLLEEALLVPFHVDGEAVGTIWVVIHDPGRRFDAEDLRVLSSLGAFAAAAHQTLLSMRSANSANQGLLQSVVAAQRYAAIVESADDAILSKDLDGVITSWNAGAQRIFGYMAEEAIGQSVTMLIPPDRLSEESMILARIRRGERVEHYETVRQRKDGSLIDISLTVSPVRDDAGVVIGASKIARDITDRRLAEEQQKLLLGEMRHRVKNLFAVANSVVALSARSPAPARELVATIQERLAALARAHELTRPGVAGHDVAAAGATTLHALIRTIVAPHVDHDSGGEESARIAIDGPDIAIGAKTITNLSLVLHELATNAAKYGGLSSPDGGVRIDCSVEDGQLRLVWSEHGGPSLRGAPDHEGFGGSLVRRIVTRQFGGLLSRDWRPDGMTLEMFAPVVRLAD